MVPAAIAPLAETAGGTTGPSTSAAATSSSTTTAISSSGMEETSCGTALLSNTAWLTQLPISQMTMTMYIPTACVGAVIGRKGSTIALIQKQAQTNPHGPPIRVSVCSSDKTLNNSTNSNSNNNYSSNYTGDTTTTTSSTTNGTSAPTTIATTTNATTATTMDVVVDPTTLAASSGPAPSTFTPLDFSDPQWTPVVIRADPLAVWKVATQLEQFVLSSSSSSSSPLLLQQHQRQDSILDIPLGRQRHAALVGKRGYTLQHVSATSTCRIHVPPKELKLDIIQLEGSLKQLQACLELLATTLGSSSTTMPSSTTTTTTPPPPSSPGNAKTMGQRSQASLTVTQLPSQTKLRSVGRKTDTIIKKRKNNNTTTTTSTTSTTDETGNKDCWTLTIFGPTAAQVQSAHAMLTKWAEGNSASIPSTSPAPSSSTNNSASEDVITPGGGANGGGIGVDETGSTTTTTSLVRSPRSSPATHPPSTTASTTTTATTPSPRNKALGRGRGGSGRGSGNRGRGGGHRGGRSATNPTGNGRGREGRGTAISTTL